MENEKKDKDNRKEKTTTLLIFLAIATMLVTMVGATFAFYTITVTGNNTASSVIIKTATVGITYDGGNEVRAEYIKPGDTIPTKTFTVQNTGNSSMNYIIKWTNITNDFAVKSDLQFKLTGVTTSGGGTPANVAITQAPSTNTTIATGLVINANAKHTYTLEMFFIDTGLPNQNANQDKTFYGKIEIELQ